MKLLTLCQIKITNIGMREMRKDISKPGIELLTPCVINRFILEIGEVRGHSWIRFEITYILSRQKDQSERNIHEKK